MRCYSKDTCFSLGDPQGQHRISFPTFLLSAHPFISVDRLGTKRPVSLDMLFIGWKSRNVGRVGPCEELPEMTGWCFLNFSPLRATLFSRTPYRWFKGNNHYQTLTFFMKYLPCSRKSFKNCISIAHFNFMAALKSRCCYCQWCFDKEQRQ